LFLYFFFFEQAPASFIAEKKPQRGIQQGKSHRAITGKQKLKSLPEGNNKPVGQSSE
jgi:hypothetical protein